MGDLSWRLRVFLTRVRHSVVIFFKAPGVYRNWFYFLYSRWTNAPGILELRSGIRMTIRPRSSDRAVVTEVFVLHTYDLDNRFLVQESDIVMDVGANIGAFTVLAGRRAGRGQVYAIEPSRNNFAQLSENVRLNELRHVHLFNVALDATEGETILNMGGACPSLVSNAEFNLSEKVRTETLAGFLKHEGLNRVDLLKMDCEGSEFDILMSAPQEALACIRRIIMEYHNVSAEKNAGTLERFLKQAGFNVETEGTGWNGQITAWRN